MDAPYPMQLNWGGGVGGVSADLMPLVSLRDVTGRARVGATAKLAVSITTSESTRRMRAQRARANSVCDGPRDLPADLPSGCVNLHLALWKGWTPRPRCIAISKVPRLESQVLLPHKGALPQGTGKHRGFSARDLHERAPGRRKSVMRVARRLSGPALQLAPPSVDPAYGRVDAVGVSHLHWNSRRIRSGL